MANNTDMIKRLPSIFQSVTERKFFDATFDQVFSKRNAERTTGFLGRQVSGEFDPVHDYYLSEPTKERTRYHLEPTFVSKDIESLEKTNHMFYMDLVNRIRYYGGNTGNHDRLFNSAFYSYAPPIDIDKFTNFHNYYWVPDKIATIAIIGITDIDITTLIIGQSEFNTTDIPAAIPQDVQFTNGLRVSFPDSINYTESFTIEGVGSAIRLVPDYLEVLSSTKFTLLPWDGIKTSDETNEILDNTMWDNNPWDSLGIETHAPDYITMERGTIDRNAWSRSNKWYHVDTILQANKFTNSVFPVNSSRALRPIIEYIKDLELFNSGSNFLRTINYFIRTRNLDDLLGCYSGHTENDGTFIPILFDDVHNRSLESVKSFWPLRNIAAGETILFPCAAIDNASIWEISIVTNTVVLTEIEVASDGDIILVTSGQTLIEDVYNGYKGFTYYYDMFTWHVAANQKVRENQPMLFNLYDAEYNILSDQAVYPNTTFLGSEIFSYKINDEAGAQPDPVLQVPLVYKSLGQLSDIIFENDLNTDRFQYIIGETTLPISGQYFYRIQTTNDDQDDSITWTLDNSWYKHEHNSKQEVIDKFVVFDTENLEYIISVKPLNDDPVNITIIVNGVETVEFDYSIINGDPTVALHQTFADGLSKDSSLDIITYTYDMLDPGSRGYFEIPQQLESNPLNNEIAEQSYGEFIPHFSSIIKNQEGFVGIPLGSNNYRDSAKDLSQGKFILQNEGSMLKSMLVSSEDEIDVIRASRYSQNTYITFKAKFLKVARQLDVRGFVPSLTTGDMSIDLWMEEILNVLTISKEFSESFAYSYMIARAEVIRADLTAVLNFTQPQSFIIDSANPRNSIYLYNITVGINGLIETENLLQADVDYIITPNESITLITFNNTENVTMGDDILVKMYEDPSPAYIPSTPAKLGMGRVYRPMLTLRETYLNPCFVIIGHDGSESPVYGSYDVAHFQGTGEVVLETGETEDIRDMLLLELEKRIYNDIDEKFRIDYELLLRIEDIRPGAMRTWNDTNEAFSTNEVNRYSREEYLDITESFFYKWTAENRADYKVNEFYNVTEWKTWNYNSQTDSNTGVALPGHWQGIFRWYYDSIRPGTHPWELLGFSIMPDWWEITDDTGDGFIGYGPAPYLSTNTLMWNDLRDGNIRKGNRIGIDERYIRPALFSYLPVDTLGNLLDIKTIFSLPFSTWDGQDDEWKYGDGGPVEQSWYNSSDYCYSQVEFFYLMKNSEFGEKFWNPANAGFIGDQFIDTTTNERARISDALVHGEKIDNKVIYATGYQQYISDRLLFLGKNVTNTFGSKARNLNVNLGHRMGSFTDQDTIRLSLQSNSTESITSNLIIPTNNYQVYLHTGSSIKDYVYSGVIIRTNSDSSFTIYGYDLLDQVFKVFPFVNTSRQYQIHQGGTPVSFTNFKFGIPYQAGDVVKYNSSFYRALTTHIATTFLSTMWNKLPSLPEIGGVSVTYYPDRSGTPDLIPYGTRFKTVQEVYDFLIGYGAWLESDGWKFETINELNQTLNWKQSGDQFLFWVVDNWETDNALFLSPGADRMTLQVEEGYPDHVERLTNGVYSILNKRGIAIHPNDTLINRDDQIIQIIPKNLNTGVYYFRVSSKETEHILLVDNTTEFNDIIYDPLLNVRQDRLTFTGTRTLDWFGKLQAGGFLIENSSLVQNFENITESLRHLYNTETSLDNPELDAAAKHLIGYGDREELLPDELTTNVQFNFYQGFIREKGTANAIDTLLRLNTVVDEENIAYYEEWAIKLGEMAGSAENVTLEFLSKFVNITGDPQAYRLNYISDDHGTVTEIILFNAEELYNVPPAIIFDNEFAFMSQRNAGELGISIRTATAIAILGDDKKIERIEITDGGSGYNAAPEIRIEPALDPDTGMSTFSLVARVAKYAILPEISDSSFSVYTPSIKHDDPFDSIIDIDIDDTDTWILRPEVPEDTRLMPVTDKNWTEFSFPNAGYVHKHDVRLLAYDEDALFESYDYSLLTEPSAGSVTHATGKTIWIANNIQQTWGVYEVVDIAAASQLEQGKPDIKCDDIPTIAGILYSTNEEICDLVDDIEETEKLVEVAEAAIVVAEAENEELNAREQQLILESDVAEGTLRSTGNFANEEVINSSTKDRYTTTVNLLSDEILDIDDRVDRYKALQAEYDAVKIATEATENIGTGAQLTRLQGELTALRIELDKKADEILVDGISGEIEIAVNAYKVELEKVLSEDGGGVPINTDYEDAKIKVIQAYQDFAAGAEAVNSKNIELRQVREGTFFLETGELIKNGLLQVNNALTNLTQGLAEYNKTLVAQNNELEQLVRDQNEADGGDGDIENIFNENMALLTIDSAKFDKGSTRLLKFKRYLNTIFDEGVLPVDIDDIPIEGAEHIDHNVLCGLISITLFAKDENGNITDQVVLNRIYKYCRLEGQQYYLRHQDGSAVAFDEEFGQFDVGTATYEVFINLRFSDVTERTNSGVTTDTYTWIDKWADPTPQPVTEFKEGKWVVEDGTNGNVADTHRVQDDLINTCVFENSFMREEHSGNTILRLPVYDPFKGLIPGISEQNISIKAIDEPFKYTHSNNPLLINSNLAVGDSGVGKLWWDLSTTRFLYYEQPSLYHGKDDSKERTNTLNYRRDNWGKIFPGSSIDIYEWVRSFNPPGEYSGDGIPRNSTDYTLVTKTNLLTNLQESVYYYWVKDRTEKPTHLPNRTLTANETSRLIVDPRAYLYPWFSPIQYTEESVSYAYANVNHLLSTSNIVLQINYALRENANDDSAQWHLLREGDKFSPISDELWEKTVNSLTGYTQPLPAENYPNGLPVLDNFVVLPVPARNVSESEKYGIKIRPQQSIFIDKHAARKIMMQKINLLLSKIQLWNPRFSLWDESILSTQYWEYIDWFKTGYNESSTISKRQVTDIDELDVLAPTLIDGELVKVYPFIPSASDRYEIYSYNLVDDSFNLVRRELGTIRMLDDIYKIKNSALLRYEIRALLNALREDVFIDEFSVNENLLFFALINYAISEQPNLDWIFKTTYISFLQDRVLLDQRPNFQRDLLDEFIKYIIQAKPYHTKIRTTNTSVSTDPDIGCGIAYDDAIGSCGDVSWGPIAFPSFPDPVYAGAIIDETWVWDNNCIAEHLRTFTIGMDISRVWCNQAEKDAYEVDLSYPNWPGKCEQRLIIDGSGFTLGWDNTPWDAMAYLIGFDSFTGIPSNYSTSDGGMSWDNDIDDYTLFTIAWDSIEIANVIGTMKFGENEDLIVDGATFNKFDAIPEEVALISPNENIVINVNYRVYDDPSDPPHLGIVITESNMYEESYKFNIHSMGWIEYILLDPTGTATPVYTTTLAANVVTGDTRIAVVDASVLPPATTQKRGVAWVNNERIEYIDIVGNDLIGIIRGTFGTAIYNNHVIGDPVHDGSTARYVSNPDDIEIHSSMRTELPDSAFTPITDPWFTTPLTALDGDKVLTVDPDPITGEVGDVILIRGLGVVPPIVTSIVELVAGSCTYPIGSGGCTSIGTYIATFVSADLPANTTVEWTKPIGPGILTTQINDISGGTSTINVEINSENEENIELRFEVTNSAGTGSSQEPFVHTRTITDPTADRIDSGPDQTNVCGDTVSVEAIPYDTNGEIITDLTNYTILWEQIDGPAVIIISPTELITEITLHPSIRETIILRVTLTDTLNSIIVTDEVIILRLPSTNAAAPHIGPILYSQNWQATATTEGREPSGMHITSIALDATTGKPVISNDPDTVNEQLSWNWPTALTFRNATDDKFVGINIYKVKGKELEFVSFVAGQDKNFIHISATPTSNYTVAAVWDLQNGTTLTEHFVKNPTKVLSGRSGERLKTTANSEIGQFMADDGTLRVNITRSETVVTSPISTTGGGFTGSQSMVVTNRVITINKVNPPAGITSTTGGGFTGSDSINITNIVIVRNNGTSIG